MGTGVPWQQSKEGVAAAEEGRIGHVSRSEPNAEGKKPGRLARLKAREAAWESRHPAAGTAGRALRKFIEDDMGVHASSFAYYAFLSVFPLLLLVFAALGFALGSRPDLQQELIESTRQLVPSFSQTVSEALQGVIDNRASLGIIGLVGLFLTGTAFADALDRGFSAVWGHEKTPYLRRKLKGLLIIGLFLVLGLFGFLVAKGLEWAKLPQALSILVGAAIAVLLNIALFAVIYSVVPHRKLHLPEVAIGASVAGVVWWASQFALRFYFGSLSDKAQVYGFLAAIVSILLWLYIGGIVIFFGSELNRAVYEKKGLLAEPPGRASY
ncbi:MAG: YihY/virulence factor BrkB family protein [Candidatus Geothermincolia bacterium]